MSEDFDVIVVGVGSMGSAACFHLARRGVRVLGLEQFDIPHSRGSHHGDSRMIRQAYYEHPDYVPLLRRAYALWDELQSEHGASLIHLTGGLYMGPPDGSIVSGSLRSAREHGLDHQLLDAASLAGRFPQFRIPESFTGFHEERAGFLLPEATVAAHATGALRRGAVLRGREPVISWKVDGGGVIARTASTTIRAARIIFTAGAWTAGLLRDLAVRLTVTRQVLAWFDAGAGREAFELGSGFPCWFIETDPPCGHYGFPIQRGRPGLKIALHQAGEAIDPDRLSDRDRSPRADEIAALRATLNAYLPGSGGSLLSACTCLYTNSPDHHFILGADPRFDGRVIMAGGFSGHGFKFASVVGEILADLSESGATRHPIAFLSPNRFG